MTASEHKKLSLTVNAADESPEVFVVDGSFKVVSRSRMKHNVFSLTPGIYTVKVSVGAKTSEQHVVLFDKAEQIDFPPLHFVSAAPLADTGKTHEYHMSSSEAQSKKVHVKKGTGSSIFVFVRDWTSSQRSEEGIKPNPRPQQGLRLLDASGQVIVDLDKESELNNGGDASAGCNVQLNPGIYRLALRLESGSVIEQTIVASIGWQTQVFLLQRDYGKDRSDRRADLIGASILLSREGFNSNDPTKRLVETARLGLINTRQVLSEEIIDTILAGKFENPMLGIFGAHLLLMSKQVKLGLLRTVVNNLRNLLGSDQHPDVEALALRLGIKTNYIFEHPPMLRRSWWQVVDATVDNQSLVPFGSMAARAAEQIWGDEPWLQWKTSAQTQNLEMPAGASGYASGIGPRAIEFGWRNLDLKGDSASKDQKPSYDMLESVAASQDIKVTAAAKAKKSSKRKPKVGLTSKARELRLDKNRMRMIVKASGLPRGNVQVLFDQFEQSALPTAVAPKPTKPTRKKKSKKALASKRPRK
jgi:hypothetical protein